jgi:hypothetical protein
MVVAIRHKVEPNGYRMILWIDARYNTSFFRRGDIMAQHITGRFRGVLGTPPEVWDYLEDLHNDIE